LKSSGSVLLQSIPKEIQSELDHILQEVGVSVKLLYLLSNLGFEHKRSAILLKYSSLAIEIRHKCCINMSPSGRFGKRTNCPTNCKTDFQEIRHNSSGDSSRETRIRRPDELLFPQLPAVRSN
jgi:hypothetical protein